MAQLRRRLDGQVVHPWCILKKFKQIFSQTVLFLVFGEMERQHGFGLRCRDLRAD